MKKTTFLVYLMLLIFIDNTSGQTKTTHIRKQTKIAKATNKDAGYLNYTIDLNADKIPVNFKGVNPINLYKNLEKRKVNLNKKEFETFSQYYDRLKIENTKPFIGKLTEDSLYFFRVLLSKPILSDFDIISYNADNEELTIRNEISWTKDPLEYNNSKPSVYIKKFSKSRKYLGSNAWGATALITEYQDYSYNLAILNLPTIQDSISNEFVISKFSLDMNTVKHMKKYNLLGCVYIGKLSYPYTNTGFDNHEATIDSPIETIEDYMYIYMNVYEIWFYNTSTGKILYKQKIKS